MNDARLKWGNTALMPDATTVELPYTIKTSSDGTNWGNAEAVVTAIRSQLQDGSTAAITSYENRSAPIGLCVSADDYDSLAAAEEALMGESNVEGYNTLSWTPSEAFAYPTVFDVVYGYVNNGYPAGWDYFQVREPDSPRKLKRFYAVTLVMLPFGRDAVLTIVQATSAPPVTPVTTSVNAATSATGWTATGGSAPTATSGVVSTIAAGVPTSAATTLALQGSYDRLYPLVFVDWKATSQSSAPAVRVSTSPSQSYFLTPYSSGVALPSRPVNAGYTRTWYTLPTQDTAIVGKTEFAETGLYAGDVYSIDQFGQADTAGSYRIIVDGSSTNGWTAVNGSAPTTSAGAVSTTAAGGPLAPGPTYLELTAAVDPATTPFVYQDWKQGGRTDSPQLRVTTAGGGVLELSAEGTGMAALAGYTRTYFRLPSAITAFAFGFASVTPGEALSIDQVTKTNVGLVSGTNRQRSRRIAVAGSARCRVKLILTAPAADTLGPTTLIYTRAATTGFQPPLRPYRVTSATVTADASTLSGGYNSLSTLMTFLIPNNRIREAAHALLGYLRATTAGTYNVTWTAALVSSSGATLPETAQSLTGTNSITFASANVWNEYEIGLLQLPTIPVAQDSTHMLRVTLIASSAVVQIDEGHLCDLENGALTIVNSTGLTRLELRPADLTSRRQSIWGGTDDGGDSAEMVKADWRVQTDVGSALARSYGIHEFKPGPVDAFTACGSLGSTLTASYYTAWAHHARETAA